MDSSWHKLDGNFRPVPIKEGEPYVPGAIQWSLKDKVGGLVVSTVFLGVDHSFGGTPRWFETMVFRAGESLSCERYETKNEAEAGHQREVERCKAQGMEKTDG